MIFDTHTDVLFDIINNNHSFSYHLHEMSGYYGAVLNYYFKGNESYDSFLFVLGEIKKFYKSNFNVIKKRNFILGIEGLGPLRSLSDIKLLKDAGIKIVTLTWNDSNKIATGTYQNKKRGLTQFGRLLLNELKKENIILDLSHLNVKSFYDVMSFYDGRMIVSHSNVRRLKNNERNLTDNQLRILKSKNILVGVNTYHKFVGKDINDYIKIINYLKSMIGLDKICLGLDFDYYLSNVSSSGSIKGLQKPDNLNKLYDSLIKEKYSREEIKNIFYKNAINFFKSTLIM